MIGRFLEISVYAPDVQESLAFYESLGFAQAPVGDAWPHAYAVVTDGRLHIGLHGRELPSPMLTFVQPELHHRLAALKALGIESDYERLGEDAFNQALFTDPNGQAVQLVEARTFSPPPLEQMAASTCGYFSEIGVPVRDFEAGRRFWEPLGFVAMDEEALPFPRVSLMSDLVNVGLYKSRALRDPVLAFEDPDMQERIARLLERGHSFSDEMPDTLEDSCNAVLIAPEGTRLLLLQREP